ncbi:MAG: hypothetical protein LBD14_00995 [Puniceicoccales bacterium]|nr:hypothetical protein [Puniceicoccales bacterium]
MREAVGVTLDDRLESSRTSSSREFERIGKELDTNFQTTAFLKGNEHKNGALENRGENERAVRERRRFAKKIGASDARWRRFRQKRLFLTFAGSGWNGNAVGCDGYPFAKIELLLEQNRGGHIERGGVDNVERGARGNFLKEVVKTPGMLRENYGVDGLPKVVADGAAKLKIAKMRTEQEKAFFLRGKLCKERVNVRLYTLEADATAPSEEFVEDGFSKVKKMPKSVQPGWKNDVF